MLSFASAVGNLYNVLGKLGVMVKNVKSVQTTLQTTMTNTTTGVVAQLNAQSDIQALIGGSYLSILTGVEGASALATSVAAQVVNRLVFLDNPQISQNLQTLNLPTSLQEVIRQMKVQNASILRMTVAATPAAFATPQSVGTGVIVASVTRDYDGVPLENVFPENLKFVCTNDSYVGSATIYNEGFTVTGSGSEQDVFAFDWPLGSNSSQGTNAIDGATSNGSGNILTNSGFDSFISNVPNNWTILTGTAGTNIFQENSIVLRGASSLKITGDGTTLISFQQTFGSTSGTSNTLSPQTQYPVNFWLRRDGTAPTGQIIVALINGDTNSILLDAAGTANSYTINLASLTTNWAAFNACFRTPLVMPSVVYLRLYMPVGQALTNNRSIYIDLGAMGNSMTQMYTSGPFVSLFSGGTAFEQNDLSTCNISNSFGAAGTLSTFQVLCNQFFSLQSQDLLLPSSITPTISDSLIA